MQQNGSTGVEDIDHGFVNNAESSSSDNEGECTITVKTMKWLQMNEIYYHWTYVTKYA